VPARGRALPALAWTRLRWRMACWGLRFLPPGPLCPSNGGIALSLSLVTSLATLFGGARSLPLGSDVVSCHGSRPARIGSSRRRRLSFEAILRRIVCVDWSSCLGAPSLPCRLTASVDDPGQRLSLRGQAPPAWHGGPPSTLVRLIDLRLNAVMIAPSVAVSIFEILGQFPFWLPHRLARSAAMCVARATSAPARAPERRTAGGSCYGPRAVVLQDS